VTRENADLSRGAETFPESSSFLPDLTVYSGRREAGAVMASIRKHRDKRSRLA
jgi:hypothetical protein